MKTVIRTWGNSLAVRIPRAFAIDMGIDNGRTVELSLEKSGLRIAIPKHDLESLLKNVTTENLHGEVPTGAVLGTEVW